MSGSVNKAILVGNLTADPEIKLTENGRLVGRFTVATSERWRDRNTGETRERTEFHRVVVWNAGLVNIAEHYLQKGAKVYIEGQVKTRKWQDQFGQDKYSTEVILQGYDAKLVMLNRPSGQTSAQSQGSHLQDNQTKRRTSAKPPVRQGGEKKTGTVPDEPIPF